MMWSLPDRLPTNLFRYVVAVSWRHQIPLIGLTVIAFLLEIVPLEIQRRVVNNLVKERPFQLVITLCAAYAGAVLIQGATKLGLNVYRGWVGENATRDLRRHVIGYSRTAQAIAPGAEARGIGAVMIVAEVEPIGGFVGSSSPSRCFRPAYCFPYWLTSCISTVGWRLLRSRFFCRN